MEGFLQIHKQHVAHIRDQQLRGITGNLWVYTLDPPSPPNHSKASFPTPPVSPTKPLFPPSTAALASLFTSTSSQLQSSNNHITSTSAAPQATQATIFSERGSGENFLGSTANALSLHPSGSSVDSDTLNHRYYVEREAAWEDRVNKMLELKLLDLHARFEDATRERVEVLHELEREEADRDFRRILEDMKKEMERRFTVMETRLGAPESTSSPTSGASGGQSSSTTSLQTSSTSTTKSGAQLPLYAQGPVRAPTPASPFMSRKRAREGVNDLNITSILGQDLESSITGMRAELETMKKELVGLGRSKDEIASWKEDLTREMEGVNAQEVRFSGELSHVQIKVSSVSLILVDVEDAWADKDQNWCMSLQIKSLLSAQQTLEKDVDSRLVEKVSREDLLDAVCIQAAEAVRIERKRRDSADPAQSITREKVTKSIQDALEVHGADVASQLFNLRKSFDVIPTQINNSWKSAENMDTIKGILRGMILDKMSLTNLVTAAKIEDLPLKVFDTEARMDRLEKRQDELEDVLHKVFTIVKGMKGAIETMTSMVSSVANM
ncbi:hypothetical protein P7C70_g5349, partial [Phenoliferia sp. Uapishka_3]